MHPALFLSRARMKIISAITAISTAEIINVDIHFYLFFLTIINVKTAITANAKIVEMLITPVVNSMPS